MDKQLQAEPISILVPTYNRHKFLPLLLSNLRGQVYPKPLLELVIDDDGDEPLIREEMRDKFAEQIKPITMKYIYNNKRRKTIGEKRNRLVKYATNWSGSFTGTFDDTSTNYAASTGLTGSTSWTTAILKPSTSINNIYSIQLQFTKLNALSTDFAATGFQINDISIIYREKPVK